MEEVSGDPLPFESWEKVQRRMPHLTFLFKRLEKDPKTRVKHGIP